MVRLAVCSSDLSFEADSKDEPVDDRYPQLKVTVGGVTRIRLAAVCRMLGFVRTIWICVCFEADYKDELLGLDPTQEDLIAGIGAVNLNDFQVPKPQMTLHK